MELLEAVRGVPGVVQMVSYGDGRGETQDLRCPTSGGQYHNRIVTLITMKSYGGSIEHFKSILELLRALRDTIAGLCHDFLLFAELHLIAF